MVARENIRPLVWRDVDDGQPKIEGSLCAESVHLLLDGPSTSYMKAEDAPGLVVSRGPEPEAKREDARCRPPLPWGQPV
jgi:hypothetical protein